MENASLFDTSSDTDSNKDYLKRFKSPRLAISGSVGLTKLEVMIVDTKEFQRLRTIKQLGTAYLVYPSATHDRFEHSLGTLDMANLMVQKIRANEHTEPHEKYIPPADEQIIRLAALLHDVTNVPFGHTLEDETTILTKHDDDNERFKYFFEESNLGQILQKELTKSQYSRLIKVLRSNRDEMEDLGQDAYISDIVKNTICADLLDYLRRDTFYCDLYERVGEMLLDYMYITEYPEKSGARRLVFRLWKEGKESKWQEDQSWPRLDLLSEMRDLLRVRFALGQKVYFHHTKIITSTMIARAIQEVIHPLPNVAGKKLLKKDLYSMGDEQLLTFLENSGNKVAVNLSSNLHCRKLHKRLPYEISSGSAGRSLSTDWKKTLLEKYHDNHNNKRKLEDKLADMAVLEPGDVLIYCPSTDMQLKEADTLVTWRGGIQELRKVDDDLTSRDINLILNSHQALWSLQVFVSPDATENKRAHVKRFCQGILSPSTQEASREELLDTAFTELIVEIMKEEGKELQKIDVAKTKVKEKTNLYKDLPPRKEIGNIIKSL